MNVDILDGDTTLDDADAGCYGQNVCSDDWRIQDVCLDYIDGLNGLADDNEVARNSICDDAFLSGVDADRRDPGGNIDACDFVGGK